MSGPYDDIIDMPHPISAAHPRMTMEERAAQFSPFAALTGYGAVIKEAARQTVPRPELSENIQDDLKRHLDILEEHISESPEVMITYFQSDRTKEGGSYVSVSGTLKRIDHARRVLWLDHDICILTADILKIWSSIYPDESCCAKVR